MRLVILLLGLAATATLAVAQPATYRFADGGRQRNFTLALDELADRLPDGAARIRTIKATTPDETKRQAHQNSPATGQPPSLVLYETGQPHDETHRRYVTEKILVHLKPGADPAAIAQTTGSTVAKRLPLGHGAVVFAAGSKADALDLVTALRAQPQVASAEPLLAHQQTRRFIPNDPLFSQQWHLLNTGQKTGIAGADVKAPAAWDLATGSGVTIGIVDDGLQNEHPDLAAHADTTIDYDWNDQDDDASPPVDGPDHHGTCCAGVAGAVGNNGLGVTGAAFNSTLVGFRLIAGPTTDLDESEAMLRSNDVIDIKSNSWGPTDNGKVLEGPGELTKEALGEGVTTGRGGRGIVYVWAGGNGRYAGDNSNFDGYANSKEVTAVGAVNDDGHQSYYSESGTNLIVTAPSNDPRYTPHQGITTVDITGNGGYNRDRTKHDLSDEDYTQTFGGTSSAAPLVAGIAALMLQHNPALGWRDVQEILLTTAVQTEPTDPGWTVNGAGFHFNDRYGAGLVDAAAAVELAGTWNNLGPEVTLEQSENVETAIPDDADQTITRSLVVDQHIRVEHAVLQVDIAHRRRGDLQITLVSPSGHESLLCPTRFKDVGDDYSGWKFSSVQDWGEASEGTWQVRISDQRKGIAGTLLGLDLTLSGTSPGALFAATGLALTGESGPVDGAPEANETVTIDLTVKNTGPVTSGTVIGTLAESGGVLSPGGAQNFGTIAAGATVTRSFTFTVGAACGTDVQLTLDLNEGGQPRGSVAYTLPVGPRTTTTYSFTTPLEIPTKGKASLYPAILNVSGNPGLITKAVLHLNGLSHHYPADLDIMLVGPAGQRIMIMSDTGGGAPLDAVDLTLDDATPYRLPQNSQIVAGTYHPTDYIQKKNELPAPAPTGGFAPARLSGLIGTDPNGAWQLFINDDAKNDGGSLNGWSLDLTTVNCPAE